MQGLVGIALIFAVTYNEKHEYQRKTKTEICGNRGFVRGLRDYGLSSGGKKVAVSL